MSSFWDWVKSSANTLVEGVKQFANADFADAAMAGAALVTAADGDVKSEEKQKVVGFIQRTEALKVFDEGDLKSRFLRHIDDLTFDFDTGKDKAIKSIAKLRSNPEAGKLLVRIVCAVGSSDGNFDEKEKAVAREITSAVGLSVNEFPALR